jgi:tetratricopeptide (TPR) repeat protein
MQNVLRAICVAFVMSTLALAQGTAPAPNDKNPPAQAGDNKTQAVPTGPVHRTPPAAKNQEEMAGYQQAAGVADPAAAEKAADDFAAKFPQSELKSLLYSNLMRRYQSANNADKTLEMAHKVLQFIPDDSVALVMAATVLAERTRDSDIDKDERYAEALKDADKAIATIDTGMMVPPGLPPEQVEQAKNTILAMAHQAAGSVALNQNQDSKAEQEFQQAITISGGNVDPLVYLRVAIAQDHQKKFAEAMANADKAVQTAGAGSPVAALASQEVDRLKKLSGGGAAAKPAPSSTPK